MKVTTPPTKEKLKGGRSLLGGEKKPARRPGGGKTPFGGLNWEEKKKTGPRRELFSSERKKNLETMPPGKKKSNNINVGGTPRKNPIPKSQKIFLGERRGDPRGEQSPLTGGN